MTQGVNGTSTTNGTAPTPADDFSLLIVGAGPVGLLIALRMAQAGVPVTVLEQGSQLNDSPRAAYYSPPAALELKKAGILDDCRELGVDVSNVRWQTLDGRMIAGSENRDKGGELRTVCCDQYRLGTIILKHIKPFAHVKILWNHKVISLSQDETKASVKAEADGEVKEYSATYVIGADGASSTTRKLLGLPFEGKTWDQMTVATNVRFPFEKYGFWDSNFIIHPDHWALICRLTKDGVWRCSYGENDGSMPRDEMIARQPMMYEAMLPGPRPLKYELENISPYKLHQRCAPTFRVGRVVLAGDAAHVCNPYGGMGLVGGLCDSGGLVDCLIGIHTGRADESILDDYSRIRRQIWQDVINPTSSNNLSRLHQDPEKANQVDPMLKEMYRVQSASDEEKKAAVDRAQAYVMTVQYDFTKLYKDAKANGAAA